MTNIHPETIGRYRISRRLGRGMMGVVYLARDPDLGREIALKVIELPPGASENEQKGFEQRFFAEAQSAARLSHPGIVTVHDVGRDASSGALFLAMQALPGQTLDRLLKDRGRLEWPEALRIAGRLADALEHAHSQGVVHRDIKPANIMILPGGEPTIMDFGIAKTETELLTATGQFIGTPLYMSPEQAQAQPVDGRSDIFSLGSVLYEMLTGVQAFAGGSVTRILFNLMSAEPEAPSLLVPSISPAIDGIVRRCLAKSATDRYRNAQALANDISSIIGTGTGGRGAGPSTLGGPGETMAAGVAPRIPSSARPGGGLPEDWAALDPRAGATRPTGKRRRAVLAAAGVIVLAIAGGLTVRLMTPPPVARVITPTPSPGSAETPESKAEAKRPPSTIPNDQPAELALVFEHALKAGILRVYVDDLRVIDRPFSGRLTRKIVGIEMRAGSLTETLAVTPGRHTVRVEVLWEDNRRTERAQTVFNPGGRLRLKAKLGSLRKNLSLEWN